MYGVNYAWHNWGADFGGCTEWGMRGVSGEPAIATELSEMKSYGVNVVRWWMLEDISTCDAVAFDGSGNPTGPGGTLLADVARALELAAEHDLYLNLTLFSFDNFDSGTHALAPIVRNSTQRRALLENVIRPVARAAESSANKNRLHSWDLINEPEWAMTGANKYGGEDFEPNTSGTLSHDEMESFLEEMITVLREESQALITVGCAAMRWQTAWTRLDLDFYTFHSYDWSDEWWPYTTSPAGYGITDKPVVMGEFPVNGLSGNSYLDVVSSYYGNGYAGALSWAMTDEAFDWRGQRANIKTFADQHSCETQY